jgi:hypothetical protein
MKVDILGTEYEMLMRTREEDKDLKELDGYCCSYEKIIVILDPSEFDDSDKSKAERLKEIKRHEITHAFLSESGLKWESHKPDKPWAKNEEMIDWFAIQSPKMLKAFGQADAL